MLNRAKRYCFTLLEVMIALSLAAILISALMSTYYQASKKRSLAQELKKSSLSVELMRQRLVHLFAKTSAAEKTCFYSGTHPQAIGTCLIFTFDNGVDRSLEFCGDVTGMLYLNARRELCLASWGTNAEARNEVLLENTEGFCLNFFDPKKKNWISDWKKEDPFPPFFKMSWSFSGQKKEVHECAFFFSQDTPATYEMMVPNP